MRIGSWRMERGALQELMFTKDMILIADSTETLEQNIRIYQTDLRIYGNK